MAKAISLVGSDMKYITIEKNLDGTWTITAVGDSLNGDGEAQPTKNMVMDWSELDVQIQNTGDNFCKHLSRLFNVFVADEDSETWD